MQTRSRARDPPPVEVAQHESRPPTAGLVPNSGRSGGIGDPTRLVVSEQGQEPQIHMETSMRMQTAEDSSPTQDDLTQTRLETVENPTPTLN